ncbi:MAG TPA: Smr/MutS family protein [Alphaproteobacteria bacterium]|nr:hypothetical protein [Rhodospirillaceae bacterium]HRJ11641.1 Smr/MutS family protein [Alphaproteobacteria bacterium]
MSDWQEVQKSARKIAAKPRARVPVAVRNEDHNFRTLKDRLPRPGAVGVVAKPKAKIGREISGHQMTALKAGSVKIDAKLDLHGLTQRQAQGELNHFMKKQIMRGARILLVITGKGKEMQGVLRQALPGWLMTGEWKNDVLTLHPAHAKHGGDGATYILLRRKIEQQNF